MQQAKAAAAKAADKSGIKPAEKAILYREKAFDAMVKKAEKFPTFRMQKRLQLVSKTCPEAEYCEANVAMLVAGKRKAGLAVSYMNDLRSARYAAGQPEIFHAFEQRLRLASGGLTFSNHGYGVAALGELDNSKLWEQINETIGKIYAEGYQAFLNSGTLLGHVRDQRLIEYDDDVDLGVILHAKTVDEAADEWKALAERLKALKLLDPKYKLPRPILKIRTAEGSIIDLFPCWIDASNKVHVFPHTSGELTAADLLPLRGVGKAGRPVPANAEKMLAINFGTDWREPNPYFKFPWTQQRKKFKKFLEGVE